MNEVSLEQMLDRRILPGKPVRLIVLRQIAEALDRAHQVGGVHGNLTPRCIFISDDSKGNTTVRVTDFGTRYSPDHELVMGEAVPEPARYMSPERVLGMDLTPRSDQFTLGILAYELVCGRKPFDASPISPLFYQICTLQPLSPEEVDPTLNRSVAKALGRALAKDQPQRFSSCTGFIEALSLGLEDCEGWTANPQAPTPPQVRPVPAAAAAAAASRSAPAGVAASTPAPAAEPEPPAFATPHRRVRRLDDEPETPAKRPGSNRKWIILAVAAVALLLLLVFSVRSSKPGLPEQVVETHDAPTTPPPADDTATASPVHHPSHAVAPPEPTVPDETARRGVTPQVQFSTEPDGASIVVDGDPYKTCTTPCTLPLSAGRHTLTTELSGYEPARRIFNLPQDSYLNMSLSERTGTLLVTTVPNGSAVFVDGQRHGSTPTTLHLAPGSHRITVASGGEQQTDTVQVEADSIQAKSFNW